MNRIISRALLFLMASASTHAFQPSLVVQTRRRSATTTALSSSTKHDDKDRRHFLTASAAAVLSSPFLWGLSTSPAQAADALDYKAVSADIAELIQKNPDWAPVRVNANTTRNRDLCVHAPVHYTILTGFFLADPLACSTESRIWHHGSKFYDTPPTTSTAILLLDLYSLGLAQFGHVR